MQSGNSAHSRIARHYGLTPQVTMFFHLLITNECVTPQLIFEQIGAVEHRSLAYRLRLHVKTLELNSQRSVGYWLDPITRRELAREFDVTNEPRSSEHALRNSRGAVHPLKRPEVA